MLEGNGQHLVPRPLFFQMRSYVWNKAWIIVDRVEISAAVTEEMPDGHNIPMWGSRQVHVQRIIQFYFSLCRQLEDFSSDECLGNARNSKLIILLDCRSITYIRLATGDNDVNLIRKRNPNHHTGHS